MPVVVTSSGGGTGFGVVIDPASSPLNVSDGSSYRLRDTITLPDWPLKSVYAGSFDTWGELAANGHGYSNGELVIPLRVYGTSATNLDTQIGQVQQKVAKVNRTENKGVGGVVEITFPSGNSYRFSATEAHFSHGLTQSYVSRWRVDGELKFMVTPGALGAEVQLATSSGNGQMVFTAADPGGDLPALGRLVVGATSQDQWACHVGVQSQHYDAASTAALSFNGTDLTPLGTSTDTGSAIRNTDLVPTWQTIGSTEIAGTGHMTHLGDFQVWVRTRRPTGNAGEVSLRLAYAQGSTFRTPTTNPEVIFDANEREGVDCWVSLGQVNLRVPVQGTNKWEGRFEAKSSVVGDEIDIKAVRLFPVTEGYIELSALQAFETPTPFSARDEFDQTAGALTGKVAPVGGTWTVVTGSGATDFQVETTGNTAEHTAAAANKRMVSVGTTNYTDIVVQTDLKFSVYTSAGLSLGLFARCDGAAVANAFLANVSVGTTAGVPYANLTAGVPVAFSNDISPPVAGAWYTMRALIRANGAYAVWFFPRGSSAGSPLAVGQDAALATAGARATGRIGLYDVNNGAVAATRNYDNFAAWVPTASAAIFSGRELELRHNAAEREETTANEWSTVPLRDGKYLRIPAGGMEGRTARLAVAAYRNDPDTMGNDNDDALTATLYGTPVYLSVPEP